MLGFHFAVPARILALTAFGLALCFMNGASFAVEGMFLVTASPGKIMAGEKVLAELPKDTRVWVFASAPGWAEVRVPNSEEHGWIRTDSLGQIQYTAEQRANAARVAPYFAEYERLEKAQDYAAAQKYLEQVMIVEEQNGGRDNPMLAVLYDRRGQLLRNQGKFAEAIRSFEEALAIRKKVLGQRAKLVANSLGDLGIVLLQQSDYPAARKAFEEAISIYREWPETEKEQFNSRHNLAIVFEELGDLPLAKTMFEEIIAFDRKTYGDKSDHTANALSSLGNVVFTLGEIPRARQCYEESLAIYRLVYGQQHSKTASSLHNLANVLVDLGDFAAAHKHHAEALAIRQKLFGREHPLTAQSLQSIGSLFFDQRDYKAAEQHYTESLQISRKIFGDEHPRIAELLNNLGNIAENQKDFATAERAYNEALVIRRNIFGEEHTETASTLVNQGIVFYKQGKFDNAGKLYDSALATYRKALGPGHPRTGVVLKNKAILCYASGDFTGTRKHWDELRRLTRRHTQLVLPALSTNEQLKYLDNIYRWDWIQSLGFGWRRRDDADIARASAEWLINGKAIAQESLAARELLLRDASNPALAAQVKELQRVREQLAALALSKPASKDAPLKQAEQQQLLHDEARLSRQLSQATGSAPADRAWINLAQAQQAIPRDGVYIDLVRMPISGISEEKEIPTRYLAWIIAAEGPVQILDLGDAEKIDAAVEKARATLSAAPGKNGSLRQVGELKATEALERDLQAVADQVLRPLLPSFAGKKQIILSPDGALWLLPWAALPVGEGKCLLEQCAVRLVLSGRDLAQASNDSKAQGATSPAITATAPAIIVNPDYDLAGQAAKAAIRALLPQVQFDENSTRGLVSRSSLPRVAALPFTAIEGAVARPMFEQLAQSKPLYYEQKDALEAVVKNLKRPRQLLFSTHGFFLADQPTKQSELQLASNTRAIPAAMTTDGQPVENPLLRCGLLLAGCNAARTAGLDDGILTGLEIVGLDLRGTELVVLSACETGIGRVRNGEGVAGLRQAFQLAGAKAVVSTLWQVPDRDSALIMQDFYTNLGAGQSKAEALRNAQLKRIEARKEKSGAAHPFFWAAWTLTE